MEAVGGGGGPAPFLIKTYEMVDDSSTDDIVSWSSTYASFVVWNPPEFAAKLLPTYFKHNNFSSFIRQLNTYGFRKIDPERWEFANEEFIKDHKHLLKNIHRRKPIHSHSLSVSSSLADAERLALEEEIERLSREKVALASDLWRFKQQQSSTKIQLEDLQRRLFDMEQRQANMLSFLDRALRNPKFVDTLINMMTPGADNKLPALHKKRRLPFEIDGGGAHVLSNQDFCDKLKLGLCSASISDNNCLAPPSTHSSNDTEGSPSFEHNRNGRFECLSFVPDTIEQHSDAGPSLCPRLLSESVDDGDGMIPCHLSLTLASSSMQIDKGPALSTSMNKAIGDEAGGGDNQTDAANGSATSSHKDAQTGNQVGVTNREGAQNQSSTANGNATSLHKAAQTSNQGPPAAVPCRVNDVFWEQFLTERPGSSDTEEASSSLRTDPCENAYEERSLGNDSMMKNRKDMEQLSL